MKESMLELAELLQAKPVWWALLVSSAGACYEAEIPILCKTTPLAPPFKTVHKRYCRGISTVYFYSQPYSMLDNEKHFIQEPLLADTATDMAKWPDSHPACLHMLAFLQILCFPLLESWFVHKESRHWLPACLLWRTCLALLLARLYLVICVMNQYIIAALWDPKILPLSCMLFSAHMTAHSCCLPKWEPVWSPAFSHYLADRELESHSLPPAEMGGRTNTGLPWNG